MSAIISNKLTSTSRSDGEWRERTGKVQSSLRFSAGSCYTRYMSPDDPDSQLVSAAEPATLSVVAVAVQGPLVVAQAQ